MLLLIKNKVVNSLKKQTLFVCFFISFTSLSSQNNLVINGGFDELVNNSNCQLFINNSVGWFMSPKALTSGALYRYCANQNNNGIPLNELGYQYPLSDSAYAGFAMFYIPPPPINFMDYKEYIYTRLKTPLVKGYTYCVEYYISLSDSSIYKTGLPGMLFSEDSVYSKCYGCLIPEEPTIGNDTNTVFSNDSNWIKINDSFIASGGEEFLIIGNFLADTIMNNNIFQRKPFNYSTEYSTYYYIDNVSVYACDSPAVEEPQDTTFVFIPNVFSPNQDGENDLWQITANKVTNLNIQVFNRWGEQVYIFNSQNLQQDTSTFNLQPSTFNFQPSTFNPSWDGYTPTGKPVPEGTYFYIVQYTLPSGEVKVEKGNLTLIR